MKQYKQQLPRDFEAKPRAKAMPNKWRAKFSFRNAGKLLRNQTKATLSK